MNDIRWEQRFNNYKKALARLSQAIEFVSDENNLSSEAITIISREGLIKCFEFTLELAWNVIKDYLTQEEALSLKGSKDAIRNAFSYGLIEDGQKWLDMLDDRNLVAHTYNEEVASTLVNDIIHNYRILFIKLNEKMEELP